MGIGMKKQKKPAPRKVKADDSPELPLVVTPKGSVMPPVVMEVAVMRRGHATEGEFKAVASSNIKSVRWERALTVEFHGGRRYTYIGVPVEVWRAMMTAESHGKFLGEHVMKKYQYRQGGEK
jgi:KTSC domain